MRGGPREPVDTEGLYKELGVEKNAGEVTWHTQLVNDTTLKVALILAPDSIVSQLLGKNGTEYQGKKIMVEVATDQGIPMEAKACENQTNQGTYSTVAMADDQFISSTQYIELDPTYYHFIRRLPKEAEIIRAVMETFREDDTKNLVRQFGRNDGLYVIETDNPEMYAQVDTLFYQGQPLAKVSMKVEEVVIESGVPKKSHSYVDRDGNKLSGKKKNELLITLKRANTKGFRHITDDDIYTKIITMDIGKVKKALTPQHYLDSVLPNGNKYFVLSHLKDGDIDRLPPSFDFRDPGGRGVLKMYLSYRGKKWRCSFCSKFHEGDCELKNKIREMEEERDNIKNMLGHFASKTYATSIMRYAVQNAVASDIDAMSGATIGNLINSIEVDEENIDVPNTIIVGGDNDVHNQVQPAEFLWSLQRNKERLIELAQKKKSVSVLGPTMQQLPSAENTAKRKLYVDMLNDVAKDVPNFTFWENPLKMYEEDEGMHPSPQQTEQLLKYMDAMFAQQHGLTYLLKSATSEIITTKRKYNKVNSLYKFGCSACSSRKKNKWFYICTDCKSNIASDSATKEATT